MKPIVSPATEPNQQIFLGFINEPKSFNLKDLNKTTKITTNLKNNVKKGKMINIENLLNFREVEKTQSKQYRISLNKRDELSQRDIQEP